MWGEPALSSQGDRGARAGCWGSIVPSMVGDMRFWVDMGPQTGVERLYKQPDRLGTLSSCCWGELWSKVLCQLC